MGLEGPQFNTGVLDKEPVLNVEAPKSKAETPFEKALEDILSQQEIRLARFLTTLAKNDLKKIEKEVFLIEI
mgnify:CR=1 FL=1